MNLLLETEKLLLTKNPKVLVCLLYENERPLQGFAGTLDWISGGKISHFLRKGFIRGESLERALIPMDGRFVLGLGAGVNSGPGERPRVDAEVIKTLKKITHEMKLEQIALSATDFGFSSPEKAQEQLKGVQLCLLN